MDCFSYPVYLILENNFSKTRPAMSSGVYSRFQRFTSKGLRLERNLFLHMSERFSFTILETSPNIHYMCAVKDSHNLTFFSFSREVYCLLYHKISKSPFKYLHFPNVLVNSPLSLKFKCLDYCSGSIKLFKLFTF